MGKRKSKSRQIAFGGMIAAVSVVLMMLTGIIPFLTYTIPIITGLMLLIVVIEFGKRWALAVYAVVSILSILFIADKESAIIYAAFFGYYPILKPVIEKIKLRSVQWILKFVVFNAALILAYFVLIKLFGLDMSSEHMSFKYASLLLIVLGNVLFLLYDVLFTRVVTIYLNIWSKTIRKFFYK